MLLNDSCLPASTVDVARLIAESGLARGYVLGGGTSIALHLAHRVSRDMDFLLPRSGSDTIASEALVRRAGAMVKPDEFSVSLRTATQVDCTIGGVRVSWLGYPFEFVDAFETWLGIDVLSLLDAAAMKAYTIGRRPAARDYVDLYHIFRSGLGMDSVVARATEIFVLEGSELFDGHVFAKQLTYTDDLPDVGATMSDTTPGLEVQWDDIVGGLREISVRWWRDRMDGAGHE